ncbi:hypothetical protein Fcan01_12704 [Folsomia candida]|uniref:Uncharacterized protein n=1 Tax=Folsomia candida TaxID=158441 RepID=A0A226E8S3_FOLCA|nr:hypothetical protein Fcan01_12704 [Folsomia candida]
MMGALFSPNVYGRRGGTDHHHHHHLHTLHYCAPGILRRENGASKFGSCYYLDISNTLHPFNQSIVVILEGFFIIKAKPDELESSYMFLVQHSREYSSSLAKQEKNSTTRHTQTLTITPVFSIMLLSRRCCCYCGVNPLWAMYRSESICIYITKDCARFSLLGWMSQQQHFGLQFRPVSHVPVKMMYGIQENYIKPLPRMLKREGDQPREKKSGQKACVCEMSFDVSSERMLFSDKL